MTSPSLEAIRILPAGRKTLTALPASAYVFVLALSTAAIVGGFGVADATLVSHHGHLRQTVSPLVWLFVAAVAIGGRIVSLFVQAQAAATLGGRNWRSLAERRPLVLVVLVCQLPLALRDLFVGGLGIFHVAGVSTLVGMETSVLDPFAWWSCVLFALYSRDTLGEVRRSSRIGLVVGFGGFIFFLKVVMALLALGAGG